MVGEHPAAAHWHVVGALERGGRASVRLAAAAAEQVSTARADAERISAAERSTSAAAQTMSAVLAAPDLIRYGLTGVDGPATAQLLWSRSRGLVLSAARLPALAAGSTYQVWLLTSDGAISAGVIAPDESGRATLVIAIFSRGCGRSWAYQSPSSRAAAVPRRRPMWSQSTGPFRPRRFPDALTEALR